MRPLRWRSGAKPLTTKESIDEVFRPGLDQRDDGVRARIRATGTSGPAKRAGRRARRRRRRQARRLWTAGRAAADAAADAARDDGGALHARLRQPALQPDACE